MWNPFKSLFKKPTPPRNIFRYWDGSEDRCADPIELYRKISNTEELDLEADLMKASHDDQEAFLRLIDVVRTVFDIAHYSETKGKPSGLVDSEIMKVFMDFISFSNDLKKNIEQTQNLQQPTPEPLEKSATK